MGLAVDISMTSEAWAALPGRDADIEAAIAASMAATEIRLADEAEVSVVLCDDATIQALNRDWRGFDKPTNVLSFPAAVPEKLRDAPLLGDIILAYETIAREAREDGKSLRDHTMHLIVHGFLHLLGHDHIVAGEAETMEALETRILHGLGIADPHADGPAP